MELPFESGPVMVADCGLKELEKRCGRLHVRQRLGIERDHEAQVFGQGLGFFHIENFTLSHLLIRAVLMMTGLYWRGRRNAAEIELKHNDVELPRLPAPFHRFTILQLSDLHVEMSERAMERVHQILRGVHYDICVLTGDYRARTCGRFEAAISGMAK